MRYTLEELQSMMEMDENGNIDLSYTQIEALAEGVNSRRQNLLELTRGKYGHETFERFFTYARCGE